MVSLVPTRRPGRVARRAARRTAAACLVWLLFATPWATAQVDATTRAAVEFGLGGHLVAGAWNPLRVTVRDVGPSVLELRIDEGSLLTGPRLVRYRASLPGGSGVTVFDDDLYVPTFRNLSWTLTSGATVLASASLGVGDSDARPLEVLLSSAPGNWRAAYAADARLVDIAASDLPARVAAYDGVASILLDGSAAAPRPEAIAAAAAGGAQVLLAGALPASQAGLGSLAGDGRRRLGAGEVARVAADSAAVRAAREGWRAPERVALIQALAADPLLAAPPGVGQPVVLSMAAAFVLIVLLGLRFGRAPGLAAALVLAALVPLAGWRLLRPPEPVLSGSHSVQLGGGALALTLDVEDRLTLPAGIVTVPTAGHPLTSRPYDVRDGVTEIALSRWHGVSVVLRPVLEPAELRFEGERLRNDGREALTDVVVLGLGRQPDLAPGASEALRRGEEGGLPPLLARLAPLLPPGTALASGPSTVVIALPPVVGVAGGEL